MDASTITALASAAGAFAAGWFAGRSVLRELDDLRGWLARLAAHVSFPEPLPTPKRYRTRKD